MIFVRPPAFRFTVKAFAETQEPKSIGLPMENGDSGYVAGLLNLSYANLKTTALANCIFEVEPNWMHEPPRVICREKWVRLGADWHVYGDHSLCYVLGDEWRDVLGRYSIRFPASEIENLAVFWCLRNVRSLLHKHIIAEDMNLPQWLPQWDFWSHGEAGRLEYRKFQKRKR